MLSLLKPQQYFPVFLIVLMLGASCGYALSLDWRRAIYWMAAAVLNAAITF